MSNNTIPKVLYINKISDILDELRYRIHQMTGGGEEKIIYGLIAIDQDAKIIAIDKRFDRKLNYWDLSSIGAALYGIARQGQDFFSASALERATIMYEDMLLFVKSVGVVNLPDKGDRELLIVSLTDKSIRLGLIVLQMNNKAELIKKAVLDDLKVVQRLEYSEKELKNHIKELKRSIFSENEERISIPE